MPPLQQRSPSFPFLTKFFFFAVVQQFYQSRVIDEFVLRGNTAILKCSVPSFVTDFVQVEAWISDDGKTYTYQPNNSDVYGKIVQPLKVSFKSVSFALLSHYQLTPEGCGALVNSNSPFQW